VREGQAVRRILRLADGEVAIESEDGRTYTANVLIDASGQATLVGKHLGTRQVLPGLKKVAYFEHFTGVARRSGVEAAYPTMVMCDEGWFWIIPFDEEKTSIGLVLDADVARQAGVPAARMLTWGIERCPLMRERMAAAQGPELNQVTADFSYRCSPYAGPGYFLVGDAATFVDPIFSTGLCLAMMGAEEVAQGVVAMLRHGTPPARVRRRYVRYLEASSKPFFAMVRLYYDHSFRELFLNGEGPFDVHKASLSVLAGSVFPRPVFALRWRLALLSLFALLNRRVPLVPRRRHFSLLAGESSASRSGASALAAGDPVPSHLAGSAKQ
jgi:flavin-dependent dehydrogenase